MLQTPTPPTFKKALAYADEVLTAAYYMSLHSKPIDHEPTDAELAEVGRLVVGFTEAERMTEEVGELRRFCGRKKHTQEARDVVDCLLTSSAYPFTPHTLAILARLPEYAAATAAYKARTDYRDERGGGVRHLTDEEQAACAAKARAKAEPMAEKLAGLNAALARVVLLASDAEAALTPAKSWLA